MQADYGLNIVNHCWGPFGSYLPLPDAGCQSCLVQSVSFFFFICPEIRKAKEATLGKGHQAAWAWRAFGIGS